LSKLDLQAKEVFLTVELVLRCLSLAVVVIAIIVAENCATHLVMENKE
jgi:hypothetical protein